MFIKDEELFEIKTDGKNITVIPKGFWSKNNLKEIALEIQKLNSKTITFDLKNLETIDTAVAIFLLETSSNHINANQNIKDIFELCAKFNLNPIRFKQKRVIHKLILKLNSKIVENFALLFAFLSFIGGVFIWFLKSIFNPKLIRFKATLYHLQENGLNAVSIIIVSSLLIGVVIAYQASLQLKQFGANIFIVEMVVISLGRELAPLICAIVIAGRSSSAYTAQIGVMKLTDEIDAMKTLGFNPWNFLILPRVIALVIALPLLVVVADVVSIFGGMIIAKSELGVSFEEFLDRFKTVVNMKHIIIGLIKAPFFGLIIALIGCFRGFQISSNTESVGKYTTISVVNAIFWVIAFNAIFSILLTEFGL